MGRTNRRHIMATASVRLDQELVEKATIMGKALNRTMPKQIEHWAKIGEMMEDNPDLPYEFVKQAIISKAEKRLENWSLTILAKITSVLQTANFKRAVKKLHQNQKKDLDKAVKELMDDPL